MNTWMIGKKIVKDYLKKNVSTVTETWKILLMQIT